jgi:hypothetical protein
MAWVRTIVVGLQLCPFAAASVEGRRVRVVVSNAAGEEALRRVVADEARALVAAPPDEVETTLVVAPAFAPGDFLRFHALADALTTEYEDDPHFGDKVSRGGAGSIVWRLPLFPGALPPRGPLATCSLSSWRRAWGRGSRLLY